VALELAGVERQGSSGLRPGSAGKRNVISCFDDAAKEFLTWADANKRARTASGYRSILKPLTAFFGGKMLSDISPFLVEKYKQERLKQGKKVAVNRELSRLRTLFNLCITWKKFEARIPPGGTRPLLRAGAGSGISKRQRKRHSWGPPASR